MRRIRCAVLFVAMAATVAACDPSPADAAEKGKKGDKNKKAGKGDKNGKGDVVGSRWSYQAVEVDGDGRDGRRIESGTYRTHDYKVYKGGNQIGTFVRNGQNALRLHVTEGKLQGRIDLVQTRNDPPTYRGEWRQRGGGTARMTVTLKKD